METSGALSFQSSPWIGLENIGRRPKNGSLRLHHQRGAADGWGVRKEISLRGSWSDRVLVRNGQAGLKLSCSYKKSGVPALESENFNASVDEALILKRKAGEVSLHLNGRCIYLVGMMGSGKTTVGKIISEALGYSFFDSDKLVEQAVGGTSVAQIFEEHSEAFFRDNESKVLRDLSSMRRLVIATGGGAVIRPINWKYMKQGIAVWLDVPLDALARRIAAVGTASRPLLNQETGDAYTKAFLRLSTLFDERGEAYANADARVCLQHIAAKQNHGDVSALTPTAIAIEALVRIENFLTEGDPIERNSYVQG